MARNNITYQRHFGGDEQNYSSIPTFFYRPVEDKQASAEAGRKIFREIELVSISVAGDNKTRVESRVNEQHKARWPKEYEAFKSGQEQATTGTPLELLPGLSAGKVAELKALKILSIEALSTIPDSAMARLGTDGRSFVTKAQDYIAMATGGAQYTQLSKENEDLKTQMAVLQSQMADLMKATKGVDLEAESSPKSSKKSK